MLITRVVLWGVRPPSFLVRALIVWERDYRSSLIKLFDPVHVLGLAASLGYGAASELLRRSTHSSDENSTGSLMLTEGNIKRLVSKLTQMRGAALKLGQFMSIQGQRRTIDTSAQG